MDGFPGVVQRRLNSWDEGVERFVGENHGDERVVCWSEYHDFRDEVEALMHRRIAPRPASSRPLTQEGHRASPWNQRAALVVLSTVLVALFFGAGLVSATQVSKACGAKWVKQAKKLEPAQIDWLSREHSASLSVDLDGDENPESVDFTSTPSFRDCNVKRSWQEKETTVSIRYADGRSRVFHWISDQLVHRLVFFPTSGRVLVVGTGFGDVVNNKWVRYRPVEEESEPTRLAAKDPS